MNKKVAIIGNGWVGKAMQQLFPNAITYVRDLDAAIKKGEILEDLQYTDKKEDINSWADVVFICVPTPCPAEGRLDTSVVEECIEWINAPLIVIRSTVNPGDTWRWHLKYKKEIVFQPEYLGETPQHPMTDQFARPFIILGGQYEGRKQLIELYQEIYNANIRIREMDDYTAEVVKLSENRAIAFKVAECQELYDACKEANVNYNTVREAVYGDDPRFNLLWTFVYPNKRGFNSKCIPKDVYAWAAWAEGCGYKPVITRKILGRNKKWLKEN